MKPEKSKSAFFNISFNLQVRSFFIRLFIIGSLWFVCYSLILKPKRIIDRPLTNFLAATLTEVVNLATPSGSQVSWQEHPDKNKGCSLLMQNDKKVFGIWDACNGIDLIFIYVSIIVLLPYASKRKIVFCICGGAIIIFANIIRLCSLYFIYLYSRNVFDFSHHYLFTILMYILIFYGWLLFTKKGLITNSKVLN